MAKKRFNHVLKPNKNTELPTRFIFFDTETDQKKIEKNAFELTFKLGVALYWKRRKDSTKNTLEWIEYKNPKTFWDFVLSKSHEKTKLYLIAHNIGFDARVLKAFKTLKTRGYLLINLIVNGMTNIWQFRKGKSTIMFLDNMNYFNLSLKRLGHDLGLEKKEMPLEEQTEKEWFEYCKRDVEIMYVGWKKWLDFIEQNDLGCFGVTLASQSFNAFRHRFNPNMIVIHNNQQATKLERQSYHGGRTECFFIGEPKGSEFFSLDVNSMYPSVMKKFEYPRRLVKYFEKSSVPSLMRLLTLFCVIARVKIKTKDPVYSYKYNDKLCFPTGVFETVLTTRELSRAIKNKEILEVFETAIYRKEYIFRDYVDWFYSKRMEYKKQGNKSFSFISKILLNSLYGKWGQKNDVFVQIDFNPELEDRYFRAWNVQEKRMVAYRVINGVVERSEGKIEAFNSFPAISSHVTADARLLLWDYIEKAGRKNVFYCDTDSLFVNNKGFENLKPFVDPLELGMMKIEKSCDNLKIRGLKDYVFGEIHKIKGIRKDAKELAENQFVQWHFEGLRGALHQKRINKMIIYKVKKTLSRVYSKGEVTETGKVLPFNFTEICPSEIFQKQ